MRRKAIKKMEEGDERRGERARKQPYFLSQRNLGQALVKDSNYALGLQYDVSQSRHGEHA